MSLAHNILAAGPMDATGGSRPRLPELAGLSDAELVAQLQSPDVVEAERAFDAIYLVFRARLVAIASVYVSRAVAEELTQDVLARVWDRRRTIVLPLGVYLYASVRNAAISVTRHERVAGRIESVVAETGEQIGIAEPAVSADVLAEREDILAAVTGALARLPDGMRMAFTLRWIHELSYGEVAAVMGTSEPAARKQVSRAREAIVPMLRRFAGEL